MLRLLSSITSLRSAGWFALSSQRRRPPWCRRPGCSRRKVRARSWRCRPGTSWRPAGCSRRGGPHCPRCRRCGRHPLHTACSPGQWSPPPPGRSGGTDCQWGEVELPVWESRADRRGPRPGPRQARPAPTRTAGRSGRLGRSWSRRSLPGRADREGRRCRTAVRGSSASAGPRRSPCPGSRSEGGGTSSLSWWSVCPARPPPCGRAAPPPRRPRSIRRWRRCWRSGQPWGPRRERGATRHSSARPAPPWCSPATGNCELAPPSRGLSGPRCWERQERWRADHRADHRDYYGADYGAPRDSRLPTPGWAATGYRGDFEIDHSPQYQ